MAKKRGGSREAGGGRGEGRGAKHGGRGATRGTRGAKRGKAKPGSGKRKASTGRKVAANVKGAIAGAVAAVTRRLPGSGIDAIVLLENDHRRLEELLSRGEKTTERAVRERSRDSRNTTSPI